MRLIGYVLLLILSVNGAAWAGGTEEDLYRGRTLVTGMREETRIPGFATCLLDVLAKLSGDARLLSDPLALEIADKAADMVTAFTYKDRLEGIPIHDEQGSRDRPYDLTVTFDPAKVDAALLTLDRKPWLTERPRLGLFLAVTNGSTVYMLARDGVHGRDQRESLSGASWQIGLPVLLPSEDELSRNGLTIRSLPTAPPARLEAVARGMGADLALEGSLIWSKGRLGWEARWRLFDDRGVQIWEIKDVNFDDAFRDALRGSALILSGGGRPQ
ncbi:DUF2066 domain-containing protein [Nordella sp. HKS 07]|uniref:DUF2066 domain-containing protein n=1 Tax=Nordella sp. HKS 07 TaxID=2712222 RepID=UPI0013E18878|nr:DUF2066 domain-containing protein [Nordella sp. HKS 07]QIG50345.1 DUF2066 domain-containing protein [Nordella sp. HKS 07]